MTEPGREMADVILIAIEESVVLTPEERAALSQHDRSVLEAAHLRDSLRRQDEDDKSRWDKFEEFHGAISTPIDVEHFPEGHPYAGFAMTTHTTPDPARARKCREEGQRWRKDTDAWAERLVGPPRPRKRRRKKEVENDPESRRRA